MDALISEIQSNERVWNKIAKVAKEGIKASKSSKPHPPFPTEILHNCCTELLVSTRYISADVTFYQKAENYMDLVISINERLPHWPDRTAGIDDWINGRNDGFLRRLSEFKEVVAQQIEIVKAIS